MENQLWGQCRSCWIGPIDPFLQVEAPSPAWKLFVLISLLGHLPGLIQEFWKSPTFSQLHCFPSCSLEADLVLGSGWNQPHRDPLEEAASVWFQTNLVCCVCGRNNPNWIRPNYQENQLSCCCNQQAVAACAVGNTEAVELWSDGT